MRFPRSRFALLALTLASSPALAQTARPPVTPVPAPPAGAPVTTPAAPAGNPAPGTGDLPTALPPPPDVNDPMLNPMPPAPTNIGSWQEALQLVRARSTDLRIAIDEVLRAEAQQRVALAGALPTINASGTLTHNFLTQNFPNQPRPVSYVPVGNGAPPSWVVEVQDASQLIGGGTFPKENVASANASIVQPLLALRAWHGIGTAKVNTEASKLSLEDQKRLISLSVANALVGVVTAERVAELNRVGLRNALERLMLTQRKAALGAANGLDIVRARQDVETARATLVTGDETLRQNRESLGLAVGIPGAVGVTPSINLDGLEQDARNACRTVTDLEQRADIQAQKTRVRVAERNVDDVWYQFAPTVNLQSTASTSNQSTQGFPANTWNIAAVLSVPLWEGGARYGFLRDQRAQADEARANLEATRRKALIEVEQARRAVTVADESAKVASDARALAVENDRLTQAAYREGQGTSLELVVAASARRQAEINLALREFDLVKARIALILAFSTCPW